MPASPAHLTAMDPHISIILLLAGHCLLVSCHTHQYSFVPEPRSWSEAQSYCRESSGTLATASSPEDMQRLTKAATDKGYYGDFWIGLYDDVDSWQWSLDSSGDGDHSEEVTFLNWRSDQPLDYMLENCAAFAKDGTWHSWPCETKHSFICYDEGESDPYIQIHQTVSFKKAQGYCRTHHTDLVTVRNQTENDRIRTKVTNLSGWFWIGLFRNGWRWTDASGTAFHNWASGQPVKGALSCGVVVSFPNGSRVENRGCSTKLPFVCCYRVVWRQIFRLKLNPLSQIDLKDPAIQAAILEQIHQRLSDTGLPSTEFHLSWTKRDGRVFHAEKKRTRQGRDKSFKIAL